MVIRMISGGYGLNYTDANGVSRFALKTPSSGWFEAPDDQAKALINAGRAAAKEFVPAPPAAEEEAETVVESVDVFAEDAADEEDGPDLSVSDVVLPDPEPKKPASRRRKKK